jgi:cell division septation protein DedD
MKTRIAIVAALLLLAPLIAAAPLSGQALDRVEEFVRVGRTEDARTVLQEWWSAERADAPQRDQQRGLWLRGRLTPDPTLADLDFQRLVVLYPSSPYAPQALLRLAQSAHAHGDGAAAERHVASIARDYPASPARADAEAWLRAAGPPPPALEVATPPATVPASPAAAQPPPVQPATTSTATPPATTQPATTQPTTTQPADPQLPVIQPATPRPPAPADAVLDWAVQFGAFTDQDRAFALHQQLFDAGQAARLVRVAGSGFLHVRIGRFATRAEASRELQRVTGLGYTAAIVRDDRAEELVRR